MENRYIENNDLFFFVHSINGKLCIFYIAQYLFQLPDMVSFPLYMWDTPHKKLHKLELFLYIVLVSLHHSAVVEFIFFITSKVSGARQSVRWTALLGNNVVRDIHHENNQICESGHAVENRRAVVAMPDGPPTPREVWRTGIADLYGVSMCKAIPPATSEVADIRPIGTVIAMDSFDFLLNGIIERHKGTQALPDPDIGALLDLPRVAHACWWVRANERIKLN